LTSCTNKAQGRETTPAVDFDVLGDEVGMVRLQVGVEVAGGANAAYALTGLNLAPEAGSEGGVIGQFGSDQLERDCFLYTQRV
jgi:hypothetical protein